MLGPHDESRTGMNLADSGLGNYCSIHSSFTLLGLFTLHRPGRAAVRKRQEREPSIGLRSARIRLMRDHVMALLLPPLFFDSIFNSKFVVCIHLCLRMANRSCDPTIGGD
jgi:hypothetical protein